MVGEQCMCRWNHTVDNKPYQCHRDSGRNEFCYWHDPDVKKESMEVKTKLEEMIRNGDSDFKGFELVGVNLGNCSLRGADMKWANLTNAFLGDCSDLREVDFRYANLEGADLGKADLRKALFRDTNLEKVKMLDLDELQIEPMKKEKGKWTCGNAEKTFRSLRIHFYHVGNYDAADSLYILEKLAQRKGWKLLSKQGPQKVFSLLFDFICGYGNKPSRVILWSGVIIVCFSLLFYSLQGIKSSSDAGYISTPVESIYFSIVTFATLGYGDFSPKPDLMIIAAIEALIGALMIALFIVTLVQRMARS